MIANHLGHFNLHKGQLILKGLVNSMNNLLSYFGLVDARISASEKDLPLQQFNRVF